MEDEIRKIQAQLREYLTPFIGIRFDEKVTKQVLERSVKNTLEATPGVSRPSVKCETLWARMKFKEKALWWLYRHVFKQQALAFRAAYYDAWDARVELWLRDNDGLDLIDCPLECGLPNYLEPDPKTIMLVDATIQLFQPLNFISFDFVVSASEHPTENHPTNP